MSAASSLVAGTKPVPLTLWGKIECICRFVLTKFAGAKDHLGQPACKEHRKKHTNSDTAILQGFRATKAHSFDRVCAIILATFHFQAFFECTPEFPPLCTKTGYAEPPKIGPPSKLQFQNSEVFCEHLKRSQTAAYKYQETHEILEPCFWIWRKCTHWPILSVYMNALNCIAGKLFIFREGKRLAKASWFAKCPWKAKAPRRARKQACDQTSCQWKKIPGNIGTMPLGRNLCCIGGIVLFGRMRLYMLGSPRKKEGTTHHFERCSICVDLDQRLRLCCSRAMSAVSQFSPTLESGGSLLQFGFIDPGAEESADVQNVYGTQTFFGHYPSRFGQTSFDSSPGEGCLNLFFFNPEAETGGAFPPSVGIPFCTFQLSGLSESW